MERDLEFNTYKGWESKNIYKTISLVEILEFIKQGQDVKEVMTARDFGKGHSLYDFVKSKRLMISWNCTFSKGKTEANITAFTGLMFMDKDKLSQEQIKEYKELLMLRSDVVACWESFGGNGIGCLIKVDGITRDNYSEVWDAIDREVNIGFDKGAKKLVQLNALSYDPDLRYNKDATAFAFRAEDVIGSINAEPISKSLVSNACISEVNNDKVQLTPFIKSNTYLSGLTAPYVKEYRFDINFEEKLDPKLYNEHGFAAFDTPIDFTTVNTRYNIYQGSRNKCMVPIATNLILLNTENDRATILYYLNYVNKNKCKPPMPESEIRNIFNSLYKKYEKGELPPTTQKRWIHFHKKCSLTVKEKLTECGKVGGKIKREKTIALIGQVIQALKASRVIITQELVKTKVSRSIRTIKKYWPQYKEDITAHNNSLESENQINEEMAN